MASKSPTVLGPTVTETVCYDNKVAVAYCMSDIRRLLQPQLIYVFLRGDFGPHGDFYDYVDIGPPQTSTSS